MRLLGFITFCAALLMFHPLSHAEVNVTVTVPIQSNSQSAVMQNARAKAVHDAIERLPALVWGSEQMTEQSYTQQIKAIGFAHADVQVLTENWDHQAMTLTITASVSWDQKKIMSMLGEVSAGQDAKRTVAQIEQILQGVTAADFLANTGHRKLEEARLLASPFHFGMDLQRYVERYEETLSQIMAIQRERLIEYLKLIEIVPLGMVNRKLTYEVVIPHPDFLKLEFESADLQEFYQRNQAAIREAIEICGVYHERLRRESMIHQRINWSINPPQDNSRHSLNREPRLKFAFEMDPTPHILRENVQPFYLFPCM